MTAPKKTKRLPRKTITEFNDAFEEKKELEPVVSEPLFDADDYNPYDPNGMIMDTSVNSESETHQEPSSSVPMDDDATEAASPAESPHKPKDEAPTKTHDEETISLLIDAVRFLYKKSKNKLLEKDTTILEKRLIRAKELMNRLAI